MQFATQRFPKEGGPEGSREFDATYNGSSKGKEGSKGCGECWHCGGWGHPRRECHQLQGKSIGALKGGKQAGGKGIGKYGKSGNGKGKGNDKRGKGYGCQYGSPGKGVGNGVNQLADDWYDAWGCEQANGYDHYIED